MGRIGSRGRRVGVGLAAVVLMLAAMAAQPAGASECGCKETGEWKSPRTVGAAAQATSPGGGRFTLETVQSTSQTKLTIRRSADGGVVEEFTVPSTRPQWGFSPDGERFMFRHGMTGSVVRDVVVLYDLDADRKVHESTPTAGSDASFSPHGRWFVLKVLNGPGNAHIVVVDASTGGIALDTPVVFSSPPGSPGDRFGTMGTGFSSEPEDRSFVWAYVATNGTVSLNVRNLSTRVDVVSTSVGSGAFWRFSPCGDAFGLVTQFRNSQIVRLHKTASIGVLGSEQQFAPLPARTVLRSTLDWHSVSTTDSRGSTTTTDIAANTADSACPHPPALSTLTMQRSTVVGGSENATATVTLSSAATSAVVVALSSSDSQAATVPSEVTVAAGARSRTFRVTSRAVEQRRAVTITASAGGVMRRATLTVTPHPATAPSGTITLVSGDGELGADDPATRMSLDGGSTFEAARIMAPAPNYSVIPGTKWVSDASGGWELEQATTLFRTAFTLPAGVADSSITVQVHADNAVRVLLNGTQIGAQPDEEDTPNFQDPAESYSANGPFVAGVNTLDFVLHNFSGPMGLDYKAVVTYGAATPTGTVTLVSGAGEVGAGDPATQVSLDGGATFEPARIVAPEPTYAVLPGTQWVSDASKGWERQFSNTLFRRTFTLPAGASDSSITVQVHADNAVRVVLNGTQIGAQPDEEIFPNFQDPAESYSANGPFVAGVNTLDLVLHNFSGPMALNYRAVINYRADLPPSLDLPDDARVNATSRAGAAVTYVANATDDSDPSPAVACSPASGTTFAIGVTVVSCSATDAGGQTNTARFQVTVLAADEQLSELHAAVDDLGPGDSLAAKVSGARDAISRGEAGPACNRLGAFVNEVDAQSGKVVTVEQAEQLTADGRRIRSVMGCA